LIAATLSTRFELQVSVVRKYLQQADIKEWGKVRQVDSEAGDTIHSSGLTKVTVDQRDATFVQVSHMYLLDLSSLMLEVISMWC